MKMKVVKENICKSINSLISSYHSMGHSLIVDGKPINLASTNVSKISLRTNPDFYFSFFNAIAVYRESLKSILESFIDGLGSDDAILGEINGLYTECRIKNINSIFSKIYEYKNTKKEKGEVPIIKCLNDLLGFRIELRFCRINKVKKILEELNNENKWGFKITNSSKGKYKAIHLYIKGDNYSLRWEVQFWLFINDKRNRLSHYNYKQSYTSWEKSYGSKDALFEVRENNV